MKPQPFPRQVLGKDLLSTSMAANMEKEVGSPVIEPLLPTDPLDDASEANKKLSNQTCNETDDPQAHQRNYRKRSVSESPEKSPEISPSSQKRKRHSDHRDERRHRRRSHSRSRSRSPRRRRSSSPRNSSNKGDSRSCMDEFGRDLQPLRQKGGSEEKDNTDIHSEGEDKGMAERKSPSNREAKARKSTERQSQSPKHRSSPGRRSKSPDKRRRRSRSRDRRDSRSPDRRRSRSRDRRDSRSPDRRRKKDYRRSPARDSRDRRHWGRSSDRHRDRGRDNRGRDWDRERKYDRGYKSRDRHDRAVSPSRDKNVFVKASSTGVETLPKPARALTSEEVQAKLSAQAEIMRKKAQEAASVLNLPSYINPTVVNPHQYAMIQQKRKLLWSGKKNEEQAADSTSSDNTTKSSLWNSTTFNNDQGGEMQAKFRRLMGIKSEGSATEEQDGAKPNNEQLMANLEREFERSRAFQLSRGAGGKSGIGLGYSGT